MDDWVDYRMSNLDVTGAHRIYELNRYDLPECNCLEKVINQAKANMADIHGLCFKGCYEAHIDTDGFEFNTCEFADSICLNARFNKITFVDVTFESCDFSNTDFSECNFIRATFRNCKIVGCNFTHTYMQNTYFDNCNASQNL